VEIRALKAGEFLSKKSALVKLQPFIDQLGVLRIGGRVKNSEALSFEEKHPIILPKNEHVANLIVRHYHSEVHHQGRSFTQAAIRNAGYWIIGAKSLINTTLSTCITCKKLRGKPETQIMGDLPAVRLQPTPPFTNIGMDCFGPFVVRDRRSEIKRWGLLLTCMYSRAVHVELLDDMTTDSLINALRSFICLRGAVHSIYCD